MFRSSPFCLHETIQLYVDNLNDRHCRYENRGRVTTDVIGRSGRLVGVAIPTIRSGTSARLRPSASRVGRIRVPPARVRGAPWRFARADGFPAGSAARAGCRRGLRPPRSRTLIATRPPISPPPRCHQTVSTGHLLTSVSTRAARVPPHRALIAHLTEPFHIRTLLFRAHAPYQREHTTATDLDPSRPRPPGDEMRRAEMSVTHARAFTPP